MMILVSGVSFLIGLGLGIVLTACIAADARDICDYDEFDDDLK